MQSAQLLFAIDLHWE